jgi:hypothetical protein
MMVSYSKRSNLFQKAEWTWRVGDGGLHVRDCHGAAYVVPWTEVTKVRLAYAPTRFKMWRHMIELKFRDRTNMVIDNVHFAGIANFENRSDTYTPFVRAMIEQIAAKAPDARCSLGAQVVGYWLAMAFLAAVFTVLVALLLAIPIDGVPGVAWIKLGIIAFFIPALIGWAVKARPRGAKITEIPESAYPRISSPLAPREPHSPRTE